MIWHRFRERVDVAPERTAVVWRGASISFASLAGMAESLAAEIPGPDGPGAHHGRPGRVLIRQADPLMILVGVLAAWRAGKTPVILRERASDAKVAEVTGLVRPDLLLTTPRAVEGIRTGAVPPRTAAAVVADPRREALAISTSGTTGDPKLVVLPAEAVLLNADTIAARLRFTPEDRILVNTPLTYLYGLVGGALAGLLAGAEVHLFPATTPWPIVHRHMRGHRIGVVQGPPSLLTFFGAFWNGVPFPDVRLVTTGGEAVRERLVSDLAATFPRADRRIIYGMTEAGPRIADDDLDAPGVPAGIVGRPYPHLRWRIDPTDAVEAHPGVGRLALAGPSMFLGYLQADGGFRGLDDDGFFRTSDLVSVGPDGKFRIHGRADRLFKSGGKLVNPNEVETVLGRHPLVRHVVCRAEPHALLGAIVVADVVPDGHFPDHAAVLRRYCEDHLEDQAIPREIRLIGHVPLAESGKADPGAPGPGGLNEPRATRCSPGSSPPDARG